MKRLRIQERVCQFHRCTVCRGEAGIGGDCSGPSELYSCDAFLEH